jgi:transcriptional regulator with XRE-family HTH domain
MSARRKTRFSDQLRQAVKQSGFSRYAICKQAGLDQSVLHRFMHGTSGLSVPSIDTICEILGLRLITEGEAQPRPPTKKGR